MSTKIETLIERRAKLRNKRFSVQFYGGWYMVDNQSQAATSHETFKQAIEAAEAANEGERNFY